MFELLKKIDLRKVLITLFLFAYFIPNFQNIDRIANQWLYLSVISILSLIYIITNKENVISIKRYFIQKSTIAYTIFIIWGFISIYYSYNKIEALITINQYFTVFVTLFFVQILSQSIKNPIKFVLKLLLISVVVEIYLSISPIIDDIQNNNLRIRSMDYIGAAANVNITSFSLLYKASIIIYLFLNTRKVFLKFALSFLLLLTFFIVFILGTRGAILGILAMYIFLLFSQLLSKEKLIQKIKNFSYLIIPLILAILLNLKYVSKSDNNVIDRAATISLSTNDGSVNQRLRYYDQALTQFFKVPFFGIGIGNWKIHSIDYDKENINGYIVPYHAHNDFLQIMVELGIIGILSYILFLFFSFRNLIFKMFKGELFSIFILSSFTIYIIDSMLNFPIARPISQLFLISLLTLSALHGKKVHK